MDSITLFMFVRSLSQRCLQRHSYFGVLFHSPRLCVGKWPCAEKKAFFHLFEPAFISSSLFASFCQLQQIFFSKAPHNP